MPDANSKPISVLIVAGGTGGHLFPARYIGEAILAADSRNKVEFVGTGRELETKIIDSAGFKRHVLKSSGVKGRGIVGALSFLLTLPKALCSTFALLKSFKPDAVIGVGGYVTVVPLLCAAYRGIPTIIHEAEIHPGMANKFLGRFVKRITVSFNDATIEPRIKVVVTGQPLRPEMKRFIATAPHLPAVPKHVLVVGGSLGAKGIDNGMIELAPFLAGKGLAVVHQTRPENKEGVEAAYAAHNVQASVVTFIEDVASAYEKADIIIARAGASTVAELAIVNRPVIFVPYPFAQGDHQTNNAMVLAKKGKALIVKEGADFGSRLRASIEQVLNPEIYKDMVNSSTGARNIDSAAQIAALADKLVNQPL